MMKKLLIIASIFCFSVAAQDTTNLDGTTDGYGNGDGSNNKSHAPSGAYLGVGIGHLWNLDANNPVYQAFLGKLWGAGDFISVNLFAEGATDFDNSWFVDGNLGFQFYPLPGYTAISPYIGLALGLGWATATNLNDDRLGLNVNGTIGLRLFKNSPVGLTIEAAADWLTKDVVNKNNPVIVTGRVGIVF